MVNTDSTNGAIIRKMIANQMGMTFFGLVVSMAAASSDNPTIMLCASIFAALSYMYLLFYLSKEQGRTDKIRIDGGRATVDRWRITKLALIANSVNIGLAVITIITKLIVSIVSNISFFQAAPADAKIAPTVAASIFSVCELIYKLIHSMYNGILVVTGQNGNPALFLVFILPSIMACTFGYWYGLKKG